MSDSEEESLDPQERLERRQRKEKKELQAKIQALKSSVPKGDKKKKKEANNNEKNSDANNEEYQLLVTINSISGI